METRLRESLFHVLKNPDESRNCSNVAHPCLKLIFPHWGKTLSTQPNKEVTPSLKSPYPFLAQSCSVTLAQMIPFIRNVILLEYSVHQHYSFDMKQIRLLKSEIMLNCMHLETFTLITCCRGFPPNVSSFRRFLCVCNSKEINQSEKLQSQFWSILVFPVS